MFCLGVQAVTARASPEPAFGPSGTLEDAEAKWWGIAGTIEYRGPVIVDEDPANDHSMGYALRAMGEVFKGADVFLRLGLRQAFWREEGDSAVRIEDVQIGGGYAHGVGVGQGDVKLGFAHRLVFLAPTSRESRRRSLYLALAAASEFAVYLGAVELGTRLNFQYRFHKYAEKAGLYANMNTRLVGGGKVFADFSVFESERFGLLRLGVDVNATWALKYASRDDYESELSDVSYSSMLYGWAAHVHYAPVPYAALTASIEHGGTVRDDGVINVYFVRRENTQCVLALTGKW